MFLSRLVILWALRSFICRHFPICAFVVLLCTSLSAIRGKWTLSPFFFLLVFLRVSFLSFFRTTRLWIIWLGSVTFWPDKQNWFFETFFWIFFLVLMWLLSFPGTRSMFLLRTRLRNLLLCPWLLSCFSCFFVRSFLLLLFVEVLWLLTFAGFMGRWFYLRCFLPIGIFCWSLSVLNSLGYNSL